jgi:hypothetical protein
MDLLIRTMTDKWQIRPLVREDAPIEEDSNFHIGGRKKNQVVGPRRVLDTKTYWLTDRQSQCDFDFDFDLWVMGGDEKGSLKSERVKYGRESQRTRTRERLRWKGPAAYTEDRHVRQGAPQQDLLTDWLTVSRNMTLTKRGSWKGAAVQRGPEPGSKEIVIVRNRYQKPTSEDIASWKNLVCGLVIC